MRKERVIWLTWERHRRTEELAKALGVSVRIFCKSRIPFFNPWWPLLKTFSFLLFTQREIIFVQNPSLLLTTAAAFLKLFKKFNLVQDLHSYFSWIFEEPRCLRDWIYNLLSQFCIRRCALTLVTNSNLRNLVDRLGGRGFVLEDRMPELKPSTKKTLAGATNLVFVCTYSTDEPVVQVIEAASQLERSVCVYITGKPEKTKGLPRLDSNVVLTGYLPDQDYVNLMAAADGVMALTTQKDTLLCGAYEAMSLSKPLILSDTEALRSYFRNGAVYTQNNREALLGAIKTLIRDKENLSKDIQAFKIEARADWEKKFSDLLAILEGYKKERVS